MDKFPLADGKPFFINDEGKFIMVAVGQKYHPDLRAAFKRSLDHPGAGDRFIIRMRGQDQNPLPFFKRLQLRIAVKSA